jgi:hypothetical protein
MVKLTPKQERFAREVALNNRTYSDAYRIAYNTKTNKQEHVWVEASVVRSHPKVSLRVQELQSQATRRLLMSRQQYLERLEAMIMADIRTLLDPQGNPLDVKDFPDDVTELIEAIEVTENFAKAGDKAEHVGYTKKIKFAGKRGLLKDYAEARGWVDPEETTKPKRIILRKYVNTEVHYHEGPNISHNRMGDICSASHSGNPLASIDVSSTNERTGIPGPEHHERHGSDGSPGESGEN